MTFVPRDPAFERRVRDSFARQAVMGLLGVEMVALEPGVCTLRLPYRADLCQQHGYLHAGITTTLADTACGYAAYTLMPADSSVVSVEFKINLLAPAVGQWFEAVGRVERPGRTLSVVRGDVFAHGDGEPVLVALMQATMIALPGGAV